jgi:hypothetical protein
LAFNPVTGSGAGTTISISAAPEAPEGQTFCFEITTTSGNRAPAVSVELNDVDLVYDISPGIEPGIYLVCVEVPNGSAGGQLRITAIASNGDLATATVTVTN